MQIFPKAKLNMLIFSIYPFNQMQLDGSIEFKWYLATSFKSYAWLTIERTMFSQARKCNDVVKIILAFYSIFKKGNRAKHQYLNILLVPPKAFTIQYPLNVQEVLEIYAIIFCPNHRIILFLAKGVKMEFLIIWWISNHGTTLSTSSALNWGQKHRCLFVILSCGSQIIDIYKWSHL